MAIANAIIYVTREIAERFWSVFSCLYYNYSLYLPVYPSSAWQNETVGLNQTLNKNNVFSLNI